MSWRPAIDCHVTHRPSLKEHRSTPSTLALQATSFDLQATITPTPSRWPTNPIPPTLQNHLLQKQLRNSQNNVISLNMLRLKSEGYMFVLILSPFSLSRFSRLPGKILIQMETSAGPERPTINENRTRSSTVYQDHGILIVWIGISDSGIG